LQAKFEGARGKLRKSIPQIGEVEDPDAIKGEPKDFSQLGQKSLKIEFKDAPIGGAPVKDAPR
jgi:hypothetical protein